MLAAYSGPTMASRQSGSGGDGLPFGYLGPVQMSNEDQELVGPFFDMFDRQPPPPAPAPAPGPPVLSSTETSKLTSLLDLVLGAETYGQISFGEGFDMPPALQGVSTSYGLSVNGLPSADYVLNSGHGHLPSVDAMPSAAMPPGAMHPPPLEAGLGPSPPLMQFPPPAASQAPGFAPPPTFTSQHSPAMPNHGDRSRYSPDVVEAATVLHYRSHRMRGVPEAQNEPGYQQQQGSRRRPSNQHPGRGPPGRHLRYQEMEEFQKEGRRMSQSTHAVEQEDAWVPWIFGTNAVRSEPRTAQPAAPVALQYGTDQSFANDNRPFEPLLEKDTSTALSEQQMSYMSAIELSRSNDTTPGPDAAQNGSGPSRPKAQAKALKIEANGRKSRKSKPGGDDDLDDEEEPQSAVSKASARKRKSKAGSTDSPGPDAGASGSSKRRKSVAAAKRENLTEDQKRENHINSEKKRRKVISTGFENLGLIVPPPNTGITSKSAVLESTVLFLQELMDGNAHLRKTYL